jgi:outer membrane protein TolC
MFRFVFGSLALLCLSFGAVPAGAQEDDLFSGASVLDREALLAAVAARNPDLLAARQAWEAARARAPQERALDNPMVSYELAPLSVAANDVPFGQTLEVRQPLPWPGRRQALGAQAEAEADAALQDSRELLLALTAEASRMYDDWYLVHRALEVNDQHRGLLETFREVAAGRYSAGLAPQQDPIQAEVEAAKLLQEREDLDAERRVTQARLNSLLHRRPELPLPPPPARLPEPPPLDREIPEIQDAAVAARPELAGLDAMIRVREAGRDLALFERKPGIELMGSYSSMWMDPEHRWMAGVSVELPLRKEKIAAARTEAETRLAAARTQRESAEMRIRAEVQEAAERYAAALRQLALHRDRLLPATRDQIRAARAGFESGGSFLALIEAERNLRDAELREQEILTEIWRRKAALERAAGTAAHPPGVQTPGFTEKIVPEGTTPPHRPLQGSAFPESQGFEPLAGTAVRRQGAHP